MSANSYLDRIIILIDLFIYFTGNSSSTQNEYESHNSSKRLKINCNMYRSIMFSAQTEEKYDDDTGIISKYHKYGLLNK